MGGEDVRGVRPSALAAATSELKEKASSDFSLNPRKRQQYAYPAETFKQHPVFVQSPGMEGGSPMRERNPYFDREAERCEESNRIREDLATHLQGRGGKTRLYEGGSPSTAA